MPTEITTALALVALALCCVAWLARSRAAVASAPVTTAFRAPDAEEWRSAALRHFHEHKELSRSVARALSTPGAVSGPARTDLVVALESATDRRLRVDTFA